MNIPYVNNIIFGNFYICSNADISKTVFFFFQKLFAPSRTKEGSVTVSGRIRQSKSRSKCTRSRMIRYISFRNAASKVFSSVKPRLRQASLREMFLANAFFAVFAAFSYPMTGLRMVTFISEFSTLLRIFA